MKGNKDICLHYVYLNNSSRFFLKCILIMTYTYIIYT